MLHEHGIAILLRASPPLCPHVSHFSMLHVSVHRFAGGPTADGITDMCVRAIHLNMEGSLAEAEKTLWASVMYFVCHCVHASSGHRMGPCAWNLIDWVCSFWGAFLRAIAK